ncbi:hypothetical protein FRB94_007905 [Tulasnella sp. JGI-2019a]|nr:hypothetical protein FRB93_007324 [Tulasnella sp. JGI-2019a]KAG8996976.1 hypothetical protein FRB94_007905 [Tulasnella sp. JGI-2019a]KAG9027914.1 hypothetical protein FRB95_007076 [Tulasnella sp. JGI-2019a]
MPNSAGLRAEEIAPSVFSISELILELMPHLHNDGSWNEKDIDTAGLVCKSWRERALNVKWGKVDVLRGLRMLGPMRALDGPDGTKEWTFDRPLRTDDWSRFNSIASRVKVLIVPQDNKLSDSLLAAIFKGRRTPSLALFPNIVTARLRPMRPDGITGFLALVPSTLNKLEIAFPRGSLADGEAEDIVALLDLIPPRFPALSHLIFSGLRGRPDLTNPLTTMIHGLPNLRVISMYHQKLSSAIDSALSTLQNLELVNAGDVETQAKLHWVRSDSASPQLSELAVSGNFGYATATYLADVAANHSPTRLTLKYHAAYGRRDNVDSILHAITHHQSLTHLVVANVLLNVLTIRTLEPLKGLGALTELQLDLDGTTVEVGDKDVGELLQSLTSLERLELGIRESHRFPLSLDALVSALKTCPFLEHVAMSVDATSRRIPAPIAFRHDNLSSLDFINVAGSTKPSPLDAPEAIAAFLSPLSAKAITVESRSREPRGELPLWAGVARLMPWFRKVMELDRLHIVGRAALGNSGLGMSRRTT